MMYVFVHRYSVLAMPVKGLKMFSHLTNICGQHNTALWTTAARKLQVEWA